MNNTIIALIPKKSKYSSFGDYRPISLCNAIYKIIAKVLANRLKLLLGKIILIEQNGFVSGREITDSILLVLEVVHTLSTSKQARIIIKLDVTKAYDRMRWPFLMEVMKRMGFCNFIGATWCISASPLYGIL